MVLYTLIFGNNVPAGLFQKIYIMIAAALILSELLRAGRLNRWECAAWSVLFSLGSAMLPISLVGAVWYEAQILAFLFSVSAIIAVRRGHITTACICYALAIGCRPFSALLGPVLAVIYLRGAGSLRDKLLRAVPGLLFGAAIACAYAAYNYMRFGDPLEFGHNYLPEFTRADHGQLSDDSGQPDLVCIGCISQKGRFSGYSDICNAGGERSFTVHAQHAGRIPVRRALCAGADAAVPVTPSAQRKARSLGADSAGGGTDF